MILPLTLILVAIGAAWVVAFGTTASATAHPGGIRQIILARQLQWPLVGVSLLLCMGVLGLVISGKRRAWWLIGLGPILALLMHRFSPEASRFTVLENPQFVEATSLAAPRDDEWVVGTVFQGQAYALPYRALYVRPLVVLTDYDKRMLLMWSAQANRATAVGISQEFRPRALELVSSPASSILVLNRRYGQYIVGITGLTSDGARPVGFTTPIPTEKMTWSRWRAKRPDTRVMAIPVAGKDAPTGPIVPKTLATSSARAGDSRRIAMIATTQPVAVPSEIDPDHPLNTTAGGLRVLVLRDRRTGELRAFDRRINEDLFPAFAAHTVKKKPQVALIDSDTASLWSIDGVAVEGALKGQRLRELEIEDELWWGVMKDWYPQLQLAR
jgi:hypothetical protein